MYIDLILFIVLVIAVVFFFRRFSSFVYLVCSVDILFRLLHFLADHIGVADISSLININESYASKINSIQGAIDIAPDNDSLKKALEEEQEKLKEDLSKELESRKTEINNALSSIGEKEVVEEPKVTEIPIEEPEVTSVDQIIESHDDNEVVSHESREDVINVILGSEEVMEGHVFPYLNGLLGE